MHSRILGFLFLGSAMVQGKAGAANYIQHTAADCTLTVALMALAVLYWFATAWSRRRKSSRDTPFKSLLVTERHSTGSDTTQACVAAPTRVPVLAGIPVIFSTDGNHAAYLVAPIPDQPAGELFRVELVSGTDIEIRSNRARITVNGEPLDHLRRCRVTLHEPAYVRLGARTFAIAGVLENSTNGRRRNSAFDAEVL